MSSSPASESQRSRPQRDEPTGILVIEAIDASFEGLGAVIKSLRDKTMKVLPGYDGVYGEPIIQKIDF